MGPPTLRQIGWGHPLSGTKEMWMPLSSLERFNLNVPEQAREEAFRKIIRTETPSLVENNRWFHRLLTDGVDVEYRRPDGSIAGDKVTLFDFAHPDRNEWIVVNQFTVIENRHNRRADLIVFVNGIPLAVLELKNPGDENATVKAAFNQLQTYKKDIPGLFAFNEVMVISDGLDARVGTITADWERFMPWRTIHVGMVSDFVLGLQPIMPLDLPVKVRSWELTVYPRSHIRRWFGVTRPAQARM